MTDQHTTRRTFLKASTGTAALVLVAGCAGGGDDEPSAPSDDDTGGNGGGNDEYDFGDWFDDVDNYDGVEDYTGESEVTVMNGAGGNNMRYDPPAIVVDEGTTVVWEWTGDGGGHDVTHEDGEFESDMLTNAGDTFEHTFDEAGTYRYYCSPHVTLGQKGVVVVE
ncbi:halocyanin domain-containing protein [Natronobiforma cellulositropha]|uniref:halocyanin domain-containing protein n=1 Tax=Natronobiforma cellulositropha TaxID=1679076 RepID=UPI0021D5DB92|nr:halocyanin domain-containing protein [Natronobiforma cellulositropha]